MASAKPTWDSLREFDFDQAAKDGKVVSMEYYATGMDYKEVPVSCSCSPVTGTRMMILWYGEEHAGSTGQILERKDKLYNLSTIKLVPLPIERTVMYYNIYPKIKGTLAYPWATSKEAAELASPHAKGQIAIPLIKVGDEAWVVDVEKLIADSK